MLRKTLMIGCIITLCITTISSGEWTNWAGNHTYRPQVIYEPQSLEELSQAIHDARGQHYSMKVIGAGHSRSPLHEGDAFFSLKHLNKILKVNADAHEVRVETGITLHELNKELADYDLCLPNQAAIDEITLGGAIATATHGTGKTGSISSFVSEIKIITADGKMHILSLDESPEEFLAARTSLGSLGIIYAVTLRCLPLFHTHLTQQTVPLEDILKTYQELYAKTDFFQFIWNTQTNMVTTHEWQKIPALQNSKNNTHSEEIADLKPGYESLCWFKMDNSKDLACEIAVPLHALPKAIEKTKEIITQHTENKLHIPFVAVRFIQQEEALLSPNCNEDVAYISVTTPVEQEYCAFYQDLEKALYTVDGKPHWGKINFLTQEKIKELYGENITRFIQVKNTLDPKSVFSNTYIHNLFGSL